VGLGRGWHRADSALIAAAFGFFGYVLDYLCAIEINTRPEPEVDEDDEYEDDDEDADNDEVVA
jgi:hypothetical protein